MTDKIATEPSCADPFDPSSISLDEALKRIEARVVPVHACERLPIRECLDRVNNEAVKSPHDVPPSKNSAMDGYAVAVSSLQAEGITELDIVGSAFAGTPYDGQVGPGQAVRSCPLRSTPSCSPRNRSSS